MELDGLWVALSGIDSAILTAKNEGQSGLSLPRIAVLVKFAPGRTVTNIISSQIPIGRLMVGPSG